jgi:hypothetical protein
LSSFLSLLRYSSVEWRLRLSWCGHLAHTLHFT